VAFKKSIATLTICLIFGASTHEVLPGSMGQQVTMEPHGVHVRPDAALLFVQLAVYRSASKQTEAGLNSSLRQVANADNTRRLFGTDDYLPSPPPPLQNKA
jgi:hypothetical protein